MQFKVVINTALAQSQNIHTYILQMFMRKSKEKKHNVDKENDQNNYIYTGI